MNLDNRATLARKSRSVMERRRRVLRRSGKCANYDGNTKQKTAPEIICHYILYPVVLSTVEKSNDFYFHALRLSWNDRNKLKDFRCQKLLRGLHLKEDDIESLDIETLARSEENGWFISSRKNDLAKIGSVAGYFLRGFACSVGKALDSNYNKDVYSGMNAKALNDMFTEMKNNQTIVPVILKVEISQHSNFEVQRFVCLTEDLVNMLVSGEEMLIPRRVKILKISTVFHDWAWRSLNSERENREQLLNEIMSAASPSPQVQCERQAPSRQASSRSKQRSTKYPSELFVL